MNSMFRHFSFHDYHENILLIHKVCQLILSISKVINLISKINLEKMLTLSFTRKKPWVILFN